MRRPHRPLHVLLTLLPLAALLSAGCGGRVEENEGLARAAAFVRTEDGLAPLGDLVPGRNTLLLPLISRSERVPRPAAQRVGREVAFGLVVAPGAGPLEVAQVSARVVRHRADECVLVFEDGTPGVFGPAVLPRASEPPRALAALARQDGVAAGPALISLQRPADAPATLVLQRLGPAAAQIVEVPGEQVEVDCSAGDVDQAVFRARRDLQPPPARAPLAARSLPVLGARRARWRGLGAEVELPLLGEGPLERLAPDAAGAATRLAGEAREWLFAASGPLDAGAAETFVVELDVTFGAGGAASARDASRSAEWLVDVSNEAVHGEPGPLLAHFEGPDEQLDIRPTMGPGAAWGDVDGDGWLDLYLVQGAGRPGSEPGRNRLLLNRGAGAAPPFEDITARAGVGDTGAGMGALFVDVNGDARLDLYVANYGRDVLYLGRGDGTFEDASAALPDLELWSAGVAAADADGDGDLDLYVTSYLEYDPALMPDVAELDRYQREDPTEMLPFAFPGQRNVFLRNDGNDEAGRPRLVDATEALGLLDVQGRGMQAVFWDFDRDADQDLYVANDVSFNVLFRAEGDGTFEDVSFSTGLDDPRGGMGLALGDVDRDGDEDLFLTNWQLEANALYLNRLYSAFERTTRRATFHDATVRAGLGRAGVGATSWAPVLFDLELDGDLDLFVANGYTSPDYQGTGICVGQPNHLFLGDGAGRFEDGGHVARAALEPHLASRGAVGADYDRDGDIDLVVTANNGPVQLLRNDAPRRGRWLGVRLRQPGPNAFAIGAEVTVEVLADGVVELHRRWLRAGEGYLTGNAPELHFGLGDAARVETLAVRWPDGEEQQLAAPPLDAWLDLAR